MPWLDGVWHASDVVPFDVTDRGLLLGDGVFDTALVLAGGMVWRRAHVARLVAAAATLGFAVAPARIEAAIDRLLVGAGHGALRVTATRGPGQRGLAPPADARPTILASLAPLNAALLFRPVSLQPAAIRRNETSPTAGLKSLGYLDAVLASGAARDAGSDDALFLNTQGRLACTSVGNVFALFGDRLVTPPLADGVVAGIVRSVLLDTCGDLGLVGVERSLELHDLRQASAIFVTNSLRLVSPVSALGEHEFVPSPVVEAIARHVGRLVRDEADFDPFRLAPA